MSVAVVLVFWQLSRVTTVPIHLLHEFVHVLAAAPWADDWEVVVGPSERDVSMDTFVEFDDDAPSLAVAFAHLAPFLTGSIGAVVAGALLVVGHVSAPRTTYELLLWSAAAMAWALYTRPSGHDIRGALAALEADDDGDA